MICQLPYFKSYPNLVAVSAYSYRCCYVNTPYYKYENMTTLVHIACRQTDEIRIENNSNTRFVSDMRFVFVYIFAAG